MSSRAEPIAVVGMSCRLPGGPDLSSFWNLLVEGGNAITDVPETRWNLAALARFNDGNPPPPQALRGGWLPRVRDFDATLFRMSPREAKTLDPKQRLILEVTHEAFEDARLSPQALRGRHDVGVFIGTAQSEYLMRFYNRMEIGTSKSDRYVGPGNDCSFTSGRISQTLGLEGPSVNVNTACSTSLVAVHQAIRALQDGECSVAAAGGVAIIESPEHSLTMVQFGVLSPSNQCQAFSADADGYVRAEGAGIVVLRPLNDALAHGDRIYGVLTGSAVNHNGLSDNIMAPSSDAQRKLLQRALDVAGTSPGEVDVIEAHGTGTMVGDPIEVRALADVFASEHDAEHPVHVASVKTNIGHGEVSAGIAGLIKTVLSVYEGTIPKHLHLERLNPAIDADLPFVYPRQTTPWPEREGPRRAMVNSFGISGINAAVVIEQAPASRPVLPDGARRPLAMLPVSAYGDKPLQALASAYADRLEAGADLHDLAFTAATGRDHHPTRLAVTAATAADAVAALRAAAEGASHEALHRGDARGPAPVTAFLFTGQGAQYVGMGAPLYDGEPAFAAAVDAIDEAFAPHLGRSIRDVMLGRDTEVDLNDTAWTQPGLFTLEVALTRMWQAFGIEPDVMIGHSIGELAAAHVAGVLSLDDACRLVAARGRLMSELPHDGAMAAIFAPADTVRPLLAEVEGVDVAADNGPKSTVISGRTEGVDAICARFEADEIGVRKLTVSHAFHSVLMEPMLDAFREVAASCTFHPPTRRLVSNLTGALADDAVTDPEYWVRHVREAVRFREGMEAVVALRPSVLLEVGPSHTLVGMGRRCARQLKATWLPSTEPERGHETLVESIARLYTAGGTPAFEDLYASHRAARVDLPPYPQQRRAYWIEDPGPPVGPEGAVAAAPTPSATGPAGEPWERPDTYRMRWMPCPDPTRRDVPRGTWLVTLDREGVGSRVSTALTEAGHTVVTVAFHGADADVVLDPTQAEAFRDLAAKHDDLRGWVHTGSLDVPDADDVEATWWTEQQDVGSLASLHIAQALLGMRRDASLVTVTRGADAVHPGEDPHLGQATAWGVARVVALEHRGFGNLRVDLDPAGGGEEVLTDLLTRLPTNEDQLAVRRGRLHALRLTRHQPSGAPIAPTPGTAWVVTGGLGALGLAVADWLVTAGATHVVLCGRSAPKPAAREAIAAMEARGAKILVESVDVSNRQHVDNLLKYLDAKQIPVRGIVHAAGVLADGPVLSQDRERFYRVFPAKVDGAWNLHRATVDRDLDAFVLFSSVTSSLGAPGQVNYAAANAFMDALAWRRHAHGLPAVSINWGPWGEIGMAARLSELMASRGMGGIRTADGVLALGDVGADLLPQVTFMDMKVRRILSQDPAFEHAPLMRQAMREVLGRADAPVPATASPAQPATTPAPAAATPLDHLRAAPSADRRATLVAALGAMAEDLLGVDAGTLATARPLAWQGLDSVMAVDLVARMRDAWGAAPRQEAVTVGPSVEELADLLLEQLDLPAEAVPLPATPSSPAAAPAAPSTAPATGLASVAGAADPEAALTALLSSWASELLGFEPGELDPDRPLAWQGFDSVMAVDLHRRIADEAGVSLKLDDVLHGPRIREIASDLLPQLDLSAVPAPTVAARTPAAAPPLATSAPSDPRAALTARLQAFAEELLGFDPGELDPDRPLAWQGFDSVMAVDLRQRIQSELGVDLALDRVLHGPRVSELVEEIASSVDPSRLGAVGSTPVPAPAPTPAAPAATVLDIVSAYAEELLGFDPGELDPDRPLAWQGFDSVMAVDLHRRIKDDLGVDLALDRLLHGPVPRELAEELMAQGVTVPTAAAAAPAPQHAPAPSAPAPAPAPATPAPAPKPAPAPTTAPPEMVSLTPDERVAAPDDEPLPPMVYAVIVVFFLLLAGGWLYLNQGSDDAARPSAEAPAEQATPAAKPGKRGKR